MTDKIRPTFTFTEDRLAELQAVVPEAFEDGRLNWDTLREALGEYLTDEEAADEHFGLNWPGKREARRLAAKPSHGTLIPAPGEGVNEDTTGNIFIEGDNLEVLKLLQKSYAGRIKMIYIDPPYNTGNDFVYKDDYSEPLEFYLRRTGQKGEKGELLTSNPKSSGRFHSNWLNMMYPRLRLARGLLAEDGIIFVSIDDNEVHNLRALMNEVFGQQGFVEQIVWKNKYGSGALTTGFANVHEYILCYTRGPLSSLEAPLDSEQIATYRSIDSKSNIRGPFITQPLATNSKDPRPNLRYPIVHNGVEIWPEKQWIWSKERLMAAYENDEVVISEKNGKFSVRAKQYLKDENGNMRKGKPTSIFNGPFNQDGTKETTDLLGANIFDFPKPSALISKILSFSINGGTNTDDIILDFFSGSASTAQSVFQLNHEDGGNRKFILVQLPEHTPDPSPARTAGYETIADIGKERLRRFIARTRSNPQQTFDTRSSSEDLGFKVLKLAPSHFKTWKEYEGDDLKAIQSLFDEQETPLTESWTVDGLTTELLLIEGFPLDSRIEPQPQFHANTVRKVSASVCSHSLYVCLDPRVYESTLETLDLTADDQFICLDSAIDDNAKIRLTQTGSLKTI